MKNQPQIPASFQLSTVVQLVLALCFLVACPRAISQQAIDSSSELSFEPHPSQLTQINAAVQSILSLPNGELAVSTTDSLFIYDRQNWRKVPGIERPSRVFKFADRTIAIGHSRGISQIKADPKHALRIEPLTPPEFLEQASDPPLSVVMVRGHLFANYGRLLIELLPDNSIRRHALENWATSFFAIGDDLYATGGLHSLLNLWDWEQSRLVNHQHVLEGSAYDWITDVSPRRNGGVWMQTDQERIIGFDGNTTWLWPGNTEIANTHATITGLTELAPDELALATKAHGVLVFDPQGNLTLDVSTEQGLDSENVVELGTDSVNRLWTATKHGLTAISIDSYTNQLATEKTPPDPDDETVSQNQERKSIEMLTRYGAAHFDRYTPRQTNIVDDVRAIESLPNGDLAVLTSEKLLTFNGTYWQIIPNIKRPTGIYEDENGRRLLIHADGISSISEDKYGKNQYKLITPPEFVAHSIHPPSYVASVRGHLFGIQGNQLVMLHPDGSTKLHALNNWASSIFSINDELYATGGNYTLLNRWDWEKEELVDHQSVLETSAYEWFTSVIKRKDGGVWMLTGQNKVIGFDGEKTWLWPGNAEIASIEANITDILEIAPNKLAVATNSAGILIFNPDGQIVRSVSADQGLDSTGVIQMGIDNQNGLWAATKRSINRIGLTPATLLFDERHGISDSVNAIEVFQGLIHLATPSGVYTQNPQATGASDLFELAYDIKSASDLLSYRDTLLVAGETVQAIDKNGTQKIVMREGGSCFWQPSQFPDTILIGNYEGIFTCYYSAGNWGNVRKLEGSDAEVFSFAESQEGSIFGGNGGQTISRIHLTETNGKVESIPFEIDTRGVWTSGTSIQGKIYTNTKPPLVWLDKEQKFALEDDIEYFKGAGPYGFEHSFANDSGQKWVRTNPRRGKAIPRPSRQVVGEISSIGDAIETRASSLIYDSQGRAWAGGDFGLVLAINPNAEAENLPAKPDIHRLVSTNDQVELPNRPGEKGVLYLEPHQNSLRVEAYFNSLHSPLHNTFQIYIDGLDTEHGPFLNTPFREFTNLDPGRYTIVINCLSTNGQQSYFGLPIYIKAPWHQQGWAYALFVLGGFSLVILSAWIFSRNQIRRRKRLETLVNERTQEIEQQNTILEKQARTLERQNEELEEKTEELTTTTETLTTTLNALQETQDQLLDAAHTAGKAEIAINVLHNVGNVLNSLNISINLVSEKIGSSKISNLARVAKLIDNHKNELDIFLTQNPKGKAVPEYLIRLSETLNGEVDAIKLELEAMGEDIDHIKTIIAAQQTHAKRQGLHETVNIRGLCENALAILGNDISNSSIEIINEIPENITVESDKHQLLDIILNLFTNARDAIQDESPAIGVITLQTESSENDDSVALHVKDNGSGISPETLDKLFRHGFTTKKEGHGFGLHSCANAIQSLGGALVIDSEGEHKGATATLKIPKKLDL